MLKWSQLKAASKDALLVKYQAGLSLEEDADILGMKSITLKRRIREYREFIRLIVGSDPEEIVSEIIHNTMSKSRLQFNVPTKVKLTDIKYVDAATDQQVWIDNLTQLQEDNKIVSVMHACDIHFPFPNNSALEVFYQLAEHTQPDIIVVGSDSADFALLSSFKRSADLDENTPDELEVFEMFWRSHIRRLRRMCPNAIFVWIYGNHEYRIVRFLNDAAPKLRRTVMKAFKDIIKCDGEVCYLGETDYVRMGPLVVQHGKRVNQYPAKSTLADLGNQLCTQFGHVHRLDECVVAGELYTVWSVASGKLCNPPHYIMGKVMRKEQYGTTIMEVDLTSRDASYTNLLFTEDEDSGIISARFERKLFEGIA